MSAVHDALRAVCADLERLEPDAASLHFARGVLAGGAGRRPIPLDMDAIKAERRDGDTIATIAARHGVSRLTIQKRLASEPRPIKIASAEMIAAYESGKSLTYVAAQFGVSVDTCRARLRASGVVIRPKNGSPRRAPPERIERIMALRAEGKDGYQIGNIIGISRERVRQIVIKAGRKDEWGEIKPITPDELAAIELYREGMSLALAAAKAGMSEQTFKKRLSRAGATIRPSRKRQRAKDAMAQKDTQVTRLYQEGLSGKEIAAQCGLPNATDVYRHLARAGVAARNPKLGKVLV